MPAAMIIQIIIYCGSAALFFGLGISAKRRKTPANFWAGSTVDPRTVSDVPAYNHENAVMWMVYSIPYWIACVLSVFGIWADWCQIAALVLLTLACFPGLLILIRHYRKIEHKYICR